MQRTSREQAQLAAIDDRIRALRGFLNDHASPSGDAPASEWFAFLGSIKAITGNASNGASFLACLMAKDHLHRVLPMRPFDAALKPQGAAGLDIDERTVHGERVVGEIKTTTPFLGDGLGAAQKAAFLKDFKKLNAARAVHKFFFVTDEAAFALTASLYAGSLPGVKIVLLPLDEMAPGSRHDSG